MAESMNDIMHPKSEAGKDAEFPHAPEDWTRQTAQQVAQGQGLELTDDHWQLVRALHEYYAKHEEAGINLRGLHDALDERFHSKGGIKHLYELVPGGPVAQGCKIAGLEPPAGATDASFGSVA